MDEDDVLTGLASRASRRVRRLCPVASSDGSGSFFTTTLDGVVTPGGSGGIPDITGDDDPDRVVLDSEDAEDRGARLWKKALDLSSASFCRDLSSRCDIFEGGEGDMSL